MNIESKDFNKELLDYLYGEMSAKEREDYEKRLQVDEVLRSELNELKSVRAELESLKEKEVMEPFSTWNRSRSTSWFKLGKRRLLVFRPITAVAAAMVVLLLVGYLTDFSLTINGQGVQLGFSKNTSTIAGAYSSKEEVQKLVNEEVRKKNEMFLTQLNDSRKEFDARFTYLQNGLEAVKKSSQGSEIDKKALQEFFMRFENKNAGMMKEYLKLTAYQQQEYLKEMFTQFNNFYQKQREDDLMFIQDNFYELTHKQELQKQETEKALASFYTTVNQGNN